MLFRDNSALKQKGGSACLIAFQQSKREFKRQVCYYAQQLYEVSYRKDDLFLLAEADTKHSQRCRKFRKVGSVENPHFREMYIEELCLQLLTMRSRTIKK